MEFLGENLRPFMHSFRAWLAKYVSARKHVWDIRFRMKGNMDLMWNALLLNCHSFTHIEELEWISQKCCVVPQVLYYFQNMKACPNPLIFYVLKCPPNLKYNGYRVSFLGVWRPGLGGSDPTHLARSLEWVDIELYFSCMPAWHVIGKPFYVLICWTIFLRM